MRGDRMEELRESLGLSRDGLGKMLNTSRVTIWRWEKGGSEPDDETKVTLARILNTTAAYLMGETNEPGSQAQKKPSPIGPDLKHNIISMDNRVHSACGRGEGGGFLRGGRWISPNASGEGVCGRSRARQGIFTGRADTQRGDERPHGRHDTPQSSKGCAWRIPNDRSCGRACAPRMD